MQRHAPIVTLTTDFGTRDGYVGAMKGRLLSIHPGLNIVDISHDISPQDIVAGAMTLRRAVKEFPSGSIHVAVIDPGVGSERGALIITSAKAVLIGPDNGLLEPASRLLADPVCHRLKPRTPWWQAHNSFDGLAVFAPAAALMARDIDPAEFSDQVSTIEHLELPTVTRTGKLLVGQIIAFDRFGNAMTNISERHLENETIAKITCQGSRFDRFNHYQNGAAKGPVAIINSDRMLELACYGGNAERELSLVAGHSVDVVFN